MRGVAIAIGVVTAIGAAALAGTLALRAQASAEKLTGALVAAELRARPATPVASVVPAQTVAPPPRVAPAAAPEPARPPAAQLPAVVFKRTSTLNGNVVFVPQDCSAPFDVVLHFHGAYPYVKELAEKANLHAVVAVFNAGNGAERYGQAFQPAGTLSSLLKQVSIAVGPLCGGAPAKPKRVALSAWSAGYAATEKLVTRPEDRQRVDAVLLADGLHAGFIDPFKRLFAPNALQAFRELGAEAKQGQKLFAITHSSIATDGYASTTECSKLLLQALQVPAQGPWVSGAAGAFSVEGSAGDDKAAHITQFRRMDATLYSKLRERWAG
jgi:hypothetical protein